MINPWTGSLIILRLLMMGDWCVIQSKIEG